MDPEQSAAVYHDKANQLYKAGEYKRAAGLFTQALEMKPDIPVIYCNRALCYMKLAQYTEALVDAKRAIQLEVKNVKAHYIVGKVLCEKGDIYEAEKCLMKAKELAKENKSKLDLAKDIEKAYYRTKKKIYLKENESKLKDHRDMMRGVMTIL